MDSALRQLRVISGALIASVLLYVFIGERISHQTRTTDPVFYRAIAMMAILTIAIMLLVRRMTVKRALSVLVAQPDDTLALARWRSGSIMTYMLSEVLAIYGFVLRMLGFSLSQVAPFYLGALALMLYFSPRRPA